jgi:hypothetical protein
MEMELFSVVSHMHVENEAVYLDKNFEKNFMTNLPDIQGPGSPDVYHMKNWDIHRKFPHDVSSL